MSWTSAGRPRCCATTSSSATCASYLQRAAMTTPITRAYDVGCGFGRLTPVLAEFASDVVGFERRASLRRHGARSCCRHWSSSRSRRLDGLPAPDASARVRDDVHRAAAHARRTRRKPSWPRSRASLAPRGPRAGGRGNRSGPRGRRRGPWPTRATHAGARGRGMPPGSRRCSLIRMGPRVIEPGYPRADVGTFMLFGPADDVYRPPTLAEAEYARRTAARRPASRWSSPTASTTCCIPATCGTCRPRARWATPSSSASTPIGRCAQTRARRGPINPEAERAEVIAALDCVDAAVIFDEDTPHEIISRLQPDVLVKGADWAEDAIVGRDIVEARGGRVVRMPIEQGFSTTTLIAKNPGRITGDQEIRRLTGVQEIQEISVKAITRSELNLPSTYP